MTIKNTLLKGHPLPWGPHLVSLLHVSSLLNILLVLSVFAFRGLLPSPNPPKPCLLSLLISFLVIFSNITLTEERKYS